MRCWLKPGNSPAAEAFTGFPPSGITSLAGLAADNIKACFEGNRGTYANDVAAPLQALVALSACARGRIPARDRSRAMVCPLRRAIGHPPGIVRFAGRVAERDVWTAAPPLAVLARLSRLFRWRPEDRRCAAATALADDIHISVLSRPIS